MQTVEFNSNIGFGYTRDVKGNLNRNQHKFGVIINDDVDIGRFTNIDRGSWRDTVIGKGTKIDSLVHVGHNVIIGNHCLLVAGCIIGGSVDIGNYSYVGMNASIRQHLTIGKHVIIGAGAVVLKSVDDYDIVAGLPAKSIKSKLNLTNEERYQMVGY